MGREPLHGPRRNANKVTLRHTAEKCDHWMEIWQLEEEVGQACWFLFWSHASYLIIHDNGGSVKHRKNAQVHFKTSTSRLWSHVADRQAPAVCCLLTMSYLSQRTPYWACALWTTVAAQGWRQPAWPDSQGSKKRRERRRRVGRRWRRKN